MLKSYKFINVYLNIGICFKAMNPQSCSSLEDAWIAIYPKPIGVLSHVVNLEVIFFYNALTISDNIFRSEQQHLCDI